jgi:uncharacterized protein YvpB
MVVNSDRDSRTMRAKHAVVDPIFSKHTIIVISFEAPATTNNDPDQHAASQLQGRSTTGVTI